MEADGTMVNEVVMVAKAIMVVMTIYDVCGALVTKVTMIMTVIFYTL